MLSQYESVCYEVKHISSYRPSAALLFGMLPRNVPLAATFFFFFLKSSESDGGEETNAFPANYDLANVPLTSVREAFVVECCRSQIGCRDFCYSESRVKSRAGYHHSYPESD